MGATPIAQRLHSDGCRTFFTATAQEGADLRANLGEAPATLWVLNGFDAAHAPLFASAQLSAVLSTPEQAQAWRAAGLTAPVALHVDSGMNRLGVSPQDAAALGSAGLQPALVMSHLACSEEAGHPMNAAQRQLFLKAAALFPGAKRSLANTGGVYLGEDFHFDLCRPGIGLYGATALAGQAHGLIPAAHLKAPILQLHALKPGDTVGYGATFTAERPMLAATIAAGYADGLPRALSNKGWARISGVKTPILGRVSMDLTVLDVTEAEGAARAGAPAQFLGEDLDALALVAGALPYELLTGMGGRVERVME